MSIAPNEFWSRLVQSGLADEEHCRRYAAAFAKANPTAAVDEAAPLAEFLARSGVINKFQAGKLLSEGDPGLRLGDFVITGDQPVMPFAHWLPVQTALGGSDRRNGFLLRVPLAGLDDSLRGWLAAHSEIHEDSLQSIELSGGAQAANAEQMVEIFSPIPEGGCLLKLVQSGQKLSRRKAVRMGLDLSQALQAMHTPAESGLVMAHGAVAADHVWVTPKGHAVLLRDPSSPARSPRSDLSSSWIAHLESPALYAAPELSDPAAQPTIASDIYSLGCLLFSLLMGRPAFEGEDDRELFASHNEDLPRELIDAVDQGADGDPILRVLAYAMAKNPGDRFDSAQSFGEALRRAGELAESRTTGRSKSETKVTAVPSSATVPADGASDQSEPSDQTTAPADAVGEAVAGYDVERAASSSAEKSEDSSGVPADKPNQKKKTRRGKKGQPRKSGEKQSAGESRSAVSAGGNQTPAKKVSAAPTVAQSADATVTASPPVADSAMPPVELAKTETSEPGPVAPLIATDAAVPVEVPNASETGEASGEPEHAPRRRRKRNKNRLPILAGMMVLPLLMLGLAIALRGRGPDRRPPRPRPRPGTLTSVPKVPDSRRNVEQSEGPKLVNGYEIVDSDRLLWVPPYAADASTPSLELLPPGPAGVISIPLAKAVSNESAGPLTRTFGADLEPLIAAVEKRSGVSRDQIGRCTLALFPGKSGWPEVALSVELTAAMDVKDLSEKWKAFESRTPEGSVLYAGEDLKSDAYYLGDGDKGKAPESGQVTRFAVASLERIQEVAEIEGGAIPMPRNMQTLWKQTNADSDFVAVLTPNFLFADGREMINASVPEFRDALKQWLIPNVGALSLSIAAKDEAVYVELRELPSGGATAATLLKSFRESIAGWAEWADSFILESVPDPSWRLLATRLPLMLRFVADQTRSTVVGETVVASTYLPADAGAQVALGTLLAMNTPRGDGGGTVATTNTNKPLTVDEMLDRPMSLSFLQQSLQFAVDEVVSEFKQSLPEGSVMPPVRIIGGDLEKNGITQNQQIRGFEKSDVPLRQVLTDLVRGANPDKTATGPDDPKQALVWVVHPQGKPAGESEILITTRDAAEGTYELPAEFQLKSE